MTVGRLDIYGMAVANAGLTATGGACAIFYHPRKGASHIGAGREIPARARGTVRRIPRDRA